MSKRLCKVEGCNKEHHAKGYCRSHYKKFKRYGESLTPPPKESKPKQKTICSIDGCTNNSYCKGVCQKHYYQMNTYGYTFRTIYDKNKIIIDKDNNCAYIVLYNKEGIEVARTKVDVNIVDKVKDIKWRLDDKGKVENDKVGLIHRYIWTLINGDIPDNMNIGHKDKDALNNTIDNLYLITYQSKCKVEGCTNKHHSNGYCQKHLYKFKRYGESLTPPPKQSKQNEIIIDDNNDCAYIVLTNREGMEIGRTTISINKVDKVKDIKWHLNQSGYVLNNKYGLLHRYIIDAPKDMVVDHKDHDPLNNLDDNLRLCTVQQNNMNKSIKRDGCASHYKGVLLDKKTNKWYAMITINGKTKRLGTFDNEYDASVAYDRACIKYFKEFACTNHPIDNYYEYIFELGLDIDSFNG